MFAKSNSKTVFNAIVSKKPAVASVRKEKLDRGKGDGQNTFCNDGLTESAFTYVKDANLSFASSNHVLVLCSSVLVFLPLMKSHKGWAEALGVQKRSKAGVQGIHWWTTGCSLVQFEAMEKEGVNILKGFNIGYCESSYIRDRLNH